MIDSTWSVINRLPLVTVVVPARNEEDNIEGCLGSVVAQDWPDERLEVLVIDGGSIDRTSQRAASTLKASTVMRWKTLSNPVGTTPSNLNVGLAAARGDYVVRVDARSRVPAGYVRRCVELLEARPDLAVVGGRQLAVAPVKGAVGEGIARALNNRYGTGLSRYRRGDRSGATDTVYLGAFRTSQLRTVGGWDDRLATNQDFDLNRRIRQFGTIWFEAGIDVTYVPRSTLRQLFLQYHRFGRWKVRYWRLSGDRPRPRQLLLLFLPAAPLATVMLGRRWGLRKLGLTSIPLGAVGAAHLRRSSLVDVMAVAALACVAGGWTTGVWREVVRPGKGSA